MVLKIMLLSPEEIEDFLIVLGMVTPGTEPGPAYLIFC